MAEEDEAEPPAPTEARTTRGGISASNTAAEQIFYAVSPNTKGEDNATLRPILRPIGCARMDDSRFDFDSSFVLPDTTDEFALLAARRAVTDKTLLAVFGHADPVNDDDYNKELSTRRAKALYAVLVRDVKLWSQLFDSPHGGDKWGHRHVCIMLATLGFPTPVATTPSGPSREALRDFQRGNGLSPSGDADKPTRELLFASYMDAICLDAAGVSFQYQKSDFISRSANGAPNGVPDYQGCSEFNPVFVVSSARERDLSAPTRKAERNATNASNRRVVVYVFPENFSFPIDKWPCPAKGTSGCKKQFWRDGEKRRKPRERDRQYLFTGNTFACKFYDRMARGSPCEAVRQNLTIFLQDEKGKLMPDAPYRLSVGADVRENRSNALGQLVEPDVYLSASGELQWGEAPPKPADDTEQPPFKFHRTVFFDLDRDDPGAVDRELHNLAISAGSRDERLAQFREQQKLSGASDEDTVAEVRGVRVAGTELPDSGEETA